MFNSKTKNYYLNRCIIIANDLIHENEGFLEHIKVMQFDMATCDGTQIVDDMIEVTRPTERDIVLSSMMVGFIKQDEPPVVPKKIIRYPLYVHTYKPLWRFSKALGYFSPKYPKRIYLNELKLNRSTGSIVGSLIHECIHYLDYQDKEHTFGHGDNSRIGKQNTAPYYIGNYAKGLVDGDDNYNDVENSYITFKTTPIKRIIRFIKGLFR